MKSKGLGIIADEIGAEIAATPATERYSRTWNGIEIVADTSRKWLFAHASTTDGMRVDLMCRLRDGMEGSLVGNLLDGMSRFDIED